ncbi:peptidase [Catenuloplanes sp. NPDC051500]|uniref:peptidase n=1 Tax=Catenuloplanes sp. NPDC051500 TaxID=3363959 RepID=UPI0037A1410F
MRVLTVLGGAALLLGLAAPAQAAPTPTTDTEVTPSPGAQTVTKAGTNFNNAAAVDAGQPVEVDAATGEYLYWSFAATAGQVHDIAATVTLPPAADRTGDQAWTVEVFDGLRRRQACVDGVQSPVAKTADAEVKLRCTLRRVRSWAEPWSGDPLPGTYYVRLSITAMPEKDLGQPAKVSLLVGADEAGTSADDGELAAPLNPVTKAGTVNAQPSAAPSGSPLAGSSDAGDDGWNWDWLPSLPEFSARWFWTAGGGMLAAIAGVVGFALTRRPRAVR